MVRNDGSAHQAKNLVRIQQLRLQFHSIPFDDAAAVEYGKIRATLANLGTLIGPNDLMIAAIALANNLALVTHNAREIGRVPGIKLEDWQQKTESANRHVRPREEMVHGRLPLAKVLYERYLP
jgi:tRNA(fMet)-specific endonuclease VapC